MVAVVLAGCQPASSVPTPTAGPVQPFPVQPLGGVRVPVFPLTYVVYDAAPGLDSLFEGTPVGRQRVDSILLRTLRRYGPDVGWVPPDSVRRMARLAPGLLPDPDQVATSRLRNLGLQPIPEPLRADLRKLTGVTTSGRYALVPAGLAISRGPDGNYIADLSIALADVRVGAVDWSSTLRGTAGDLWDAVGYATRVIFP